ncbi:MAG: hypothetical protein GY829_12145 [Gammaproteobacteria bacterium]|nr:hypothetical protein [Gammaproteobacteria bacterium]
MNRTRNLISYKNASALFALWILLLGSGLEWVQWTGNLFVNDGSYWHNQLSLLVFLAFVVALLLTIIIRFVFRRGRPMFFLFMALIWFGNFRLAMLWYEMPVHIFVTIPFCYFSTIFLLNEYYRSFGTVGDES